MRNRVVESGCGGGRSGGSILARSWPRGQQTGGSEVLGGVRLPSMLTTCRAIGNFSTIFRGKAFTRRRAKRGPPGFTAWGKAQFDANKPSYGPRTVPLDNDPIQHCRPTGIPRILFYPQPFEIVQDPTRTFMFFEREHAWRGIWTDGRSTSVRIRSDFHGGFRSANGKAIRSWSTRSDSTIAPGLIFTAIRAAIALHLIERYKRVNAQHHVLAIHRG